MEADDDDFGAGKARRGTHISGWPASSGARESDATRLDSETRNRRRGRPREAPARTYRLSNQASSKRRNMRCDARSECKTQCEAWAGAWAGARRPHATGLRDARLRATRGALFWASRRRRRRRRRRCTSCAPQCRVQSDAGRVRPQHLARDTSRTSHRRPDRGAIANSDRRPPVNYAVAAEAVRRTIAVAHTHTQGAQDTQRRPSGRLIRTRVRASMSSQSRRRA